MHIILLLSFIQAPTIIDNIPSRLRLYILYYN